MADLPMRGVVRQWLFGLFLCEQLQDFPSLSTIIRKLQKLTIVLDVFLPDKLVHWLRPTGPRISHCETDQAVSSIHMSVRRHLAGCGEAVAAAQLCDWSGEN